MPEFKIEGEALRREARFRAFSWGTLLLLLGITVLLFVLGVSGYLSAYWDLRLLFVFSLLGTVIVACALACHEAMHFAARQMIFVLEDNQIVRKRHGFPEVRIPFSEMDTLSEGLGWLIIRSAEPKRKIAIPDSVSGYEVIRNELTAIHPLSTAAAFPLRDTVLLLVAFLGWAAVLGLRNKWGLLAGGSVAIVTLAFGSCRLWTLLHRSSKRLLLWASLGFIWLVALLFIYLRLRY